jgi:hypothetical protein
VRRRLLATYPHFLPCFPEAIQSRITGHMLERAAAWGLQQQASLWTWCALMVSVAPNFDEEPTIRARLEQDRDELDHALAGLAKTMPPHIVKAARRIGSRLPLFTAARFDGAPPVERLAAAIPTALHDRPAARAPAQAAAEAGAGAARLGLEAVADGPLVVAACQSFWGPEFTRLAWAATLWREPWSAAERVELLRVRLAAEHRRFV